MIKINYIFLQYIIIFTNMGISGFFSYFIRAVPGLVKGLKKGETVNSLKKRGKSIEIDVLAFELNPLFYNVLDEIQDNLKSQNKVDTSFLRKYVEKPKVDLTLDEMIQKIYEGVAKRVDDYIIYNKPKHSIYFVIDGVAGMSKQTQQRQRRYIDTSIDTGEKFSRTCITPGTEFLDNFSKYFKIHIKNRMKNEWKNLNVYFNDAKVVGEGEHKLMYYIKTLPTNLSVSIISPDADLFMLSMGLRRNDVYLFRPVDKFFKEREGPLKDKDYTLADIDILKNYIIQESGLLPNLNTDENKKQFEEIKKNISKSSLDVYKENKDSVLELEDHKHKAIEDFILFMMLVGNDFIPHIPHLNINKDSKNLLQYYKNTVKEYGFLTERTKDNTDITFNYKALKHLFKELSEGQREYLRVVADVKNSRLDHPYVLLEQNTELTEKGPYVHLEKYKKDYYTKKLKFGITFDFASINQNEEQEFKIDQKRYENDIKTLVNEFMKAMVFVIKYYLFKIPTYNWFYPYHYSPFLYEVWKYFPEDLNYNFDYAPPLSSIEQLMCVLPPNKARLVPESLRYLMTSPDSPISDMYPVYWMTDKDGSKNGKNNDGEGHWKQLLPFSDYNRVRENFNILKDKLTKEEKERNAVGDIYKYTFANNKVNESIFFENDRS